MIFTDSKMQGIKQEFKQLEKKMKNLGFDRWSWDFSKVIYDKKYVSSNGIDYYLRIPGTVVNDKQLEHPKAVVQLGAPIFARHFFPHGLDNEVEVPPDLVEPIQDKLALVIDAISK